MRQNFVGAPDNSRSRKQIAAFKTYVVALASIKSLSLTKKSNESSQIATKWAVVRDPSLCRWGRRQIPLSRSPRSRLPLVAAQRRSLRATSVVTHRETVRSSLMRNLRPGI